ncbi:hypothetical protein LIA77_06309 [Sarocladium implicatum]|nr:hypothetical protein LIA77_06309 [Sarocladium implicatum]
MSVRYGAAYSESSVASRRTTLYGQDEPRSTSFSVITRCFFDWYRTSCCSLTLVRCIDTVAFVYYAGMIRARHWMTPSLAAPLCDGYLAQVDSSQGGWWQDCQFQGDVIDHDRRIVTWVRNQQLGSSQDPVTDGAGTSTQLVLGGVLATAIKVWVGRRTSRPRNCPGQTEHSRRH